MLQCFSAIIYIYIAIDVEFLDSINDKTRVA